MVPFRKAIEKMQAYPPGMPVGDIKKKFGLENVIKLASNENSYGFSPRVVDYFNKNIPPLNIYPEGPSTELKDALADFYSRSPDEIIIGSGSDELIQMLGLVYLASDTRLLTAWPSFIRYRQAAELMGVDTISVPLKGFTYDLEKMAYACAPDVRMVCIANPNNPTGTYVSHDSLKLFLDRVPENVLVVIDEAYYEYVTAPDYPRSFEFLDAGYPVVILRTFSKIYGLASCRVGYAISNKEVTGLIERIRPPFNVTSVSQQAAVIALSDQKFVSECRGKNLEEKKILTKKISGMNLEVVPSAGNFILIRTAGQAKSLTDFLLRRGVIIRPMSGYDLEDFIRVTVGTSWENQKFLTELNNYYDKKKKFWYKLRNYFTR